MAYTVVRRLGRGGMGVVDLAVAPDGSPVALKRIALHGSADEIARARARIRREAEVLHTLDHPGIVRLLDVVDEGDDLVLVMPYLGGGSLHERVVNGGPLTPDQVQGLGDQLLDALATAHRQGVVHRDLKPANVLFDEQGRPHLVDFGVASMRDHTAGLTATAMVLGTPGYMAPEQARGEPTTPASDVFSLGATLLFAATGAGPFGPEGTDARVLMHRAAAGKLETLPRTLPAPLRTRLSAMLQKAPDKRPSAARLRGGPAGTRPVTALRAAVGRHRVLAALGGALLVVLGVAGAVAVLADTGRGTPGVGATTLPTAPATSPSTTVPCDPLPYRPCTPLGPGAVAPNTDGEACLEDFDDFDGDAANGCEAEPQGPPDGTRLTEGSPRIVANLVPRDAVAEWGVPVEDRGLGAGQLFCDGRIEVTLRAPAGVSMELALLDDGRVLGRAASANSLPGTVTLDEPSCGSDDAVLLVARVTWIGTDRSADTYTLERSGSF